MSELHRARTSSPIDSNSHYAKEIDLAAFRAARRNVPLLPYENLDMSPRHLSRGFRELVERRIAEGYERDGGKISSLMNGIDWQSSTRSFGVRLHGWDPINELLMGHTIFGDDRYLDTAWTFAADWMHTFQIPASEIGPSPVELIEKLGAMPWYDMAVGRRAYRLAYLLDAISRSEEFDQDVVRTALEGLVFHLQLLAREDFFQANHNHGFYQAFGELAATRRFIGEPYFACRFSLAASHARGVVDQQFNPSGIHREHSPEYHYMVMGSLIGARSCGLVDAADIQDRVAATEEVMTWLIQPNGTLLSFGDSSPLNMHVGEHYPLRFQNPDLQFQLSQGEVGNKPCRGMRVMLNEGFAFARSAWPDTENPAWWYLAQIASFSSRTHKHADDLSFVWSDLGSEVLIDPGRYAYGEKTDPGSDLAKQGFWYSDPKRIYVESTRAHNTVEIDGRSHNRKRKPYGSALTYAGDQNGLIVTECDLRHVQSARHWRVLVFDPGRFMLVIDWLHDRSGNKHDFRQYFHFHPDWHVSSERERTADRPLILHNDQSGTSLTVVPLIAKQGQLTTIRGQESPNFLGWYSDKPYSLIPCTTLFSEQTQTDFAVFATVFSFSPDTRALPKKAVIRKSMRPSVVTWLEQGGQVKVEIYRGKDGEPVKVQVSRG